MEEIKVKLTFREPILGSLPANKELHSEFIAAKAPDAPTRDEEIAAMGADEVERKEMTVFVRDAEGRPSLWDYQIKGFFKAAFGALTKMPETKCSKEKAYKKTVDRYVFVKERMIPLQFDGELTSCQRPLRAETAQGPRVALANSEQAPAGTVIEFTIILLIDTLEQLMYEWLDYGAFVGIGQWRNGSYGRFEWEKVEG